MGDIQRFDEDFDFTFNLMAEFFAQGRIQRTLNAIYDHRLTGWEKWWQIELALFVGDHEEISEWNTEEVFYTDLRQQKRKNIIAVDLCYRRRRHASQSFMFLELKQDYDQVRCITNMMKDAEKVYAAHSRSHLGARIRNFFVVGVYPSIPKKEIHELVDSLGDDYEIPFEYVDTKLIPNTGRIWRPANISYKSHPCRMLTRSQQPSAHPLGSAGRSV